MEALAGLHIPTELTTSSLVLGERAGIWNAECRNILPGYYFKGSPALCNASFGSPARGLLRLTAAGRGLSQCRDSREVTPRKHHWPSLCLNVLSPAAPQHESPGMLQKLGGSRDSQQLSLLSSSRSCSRILERRTERLIPGAANRQVVAAAGPDDKVRWWEVSGGPNMSDIHSVTEFVEALSDAGERLVVVDFYATWCGSCRSLYPKLCQLSKQYPDVVFLKVNFDENKPMCKSLNIRVLPFFHFYRGADGRLDGFSASISKIQKLRDAIATHNTERCYLGPPLGVGDIDLLPTPTPAKASPDAQQPAGASTA